MKFLQAQQSTKLPDSVFCLVINSVDSTKLTDFSLCWRPLSWFSHTAVETPHVAFLVHCNQIETENPAFHFPFFEILFSSLLFFCSWLRTWSGSLQNEPFLISFNLSLVLIYEQFCLRESREVWLVTNPSLWPRAIHKSKSQINNWRASVQAGIP